MVCYKERFIAQSHLVIFSKGFVVIKGPQGPIDIDSSVNITCRPQENIGVVRWYLIDEWNTKKTEITKGQEADFTSNVLTMEDNVHLNHISGSWKGKFLHAYTTRITA